MKKLGFTLAELLVTLGIVGVIAALTLPSLTADTQAAKIGPKLGKAVAVFEQANVTLLQDQGVDSISDGWRNASDYLNALSRYLKSVNVDSGCITTKDGIVYEVSKLDSPVYIRKDGLPSIPSQEYIVKSLKIYWGKGDKSGTNLFYFVLYNDGSLRPYGGTAYLGPDSNHWSETCPKAEDGDVTNYDDCAGHIFENNMQVLYK